MKNKTYKYLFGPVASRRLGVSLGIDLVPHKTCSLDCVYCECGKTTLATAKRKEYVPLKGVLDELNSFLSTNPKLDYITFSGAGEPTLYSKLGSIVNFVKKKCPTCKVALLTNSTLLGRKDVIEDTKDIDLIVPSLDAISENAFKKLNRPCKGITAKQTAENLVSFANNFKGKIWLEIFIVPGINDTKQELNLLKSYSERIDPDKIQINSLDRPGTETWVQAPGSTALKKIAKLFGPKAEVTAKPKAKVSGYSLKAQENIIETIKRRPCTIEEIAGLAGLSLNETKKHMLRIGRKCKMVKQKLSRGIFYKIKR